MRKFKKMPLLFGAFLLSFVLLGAGCQPTRHASPIADYEGTPYDASASEDSTTYSVSSDNRPARKTKARSGSGMQIQEEWEERTRELVLDAASVAKGTPYVFGGTNLSGFDCSGFVRWAYNAVGVDLPRSAREQSQFGQSIDRANLRMGDIVAFRHPKRGYHTGLYVGNGQFIHSPRRRDVVKISSLTDPYFSGTYLGARRPGLPDTVDLKEVEKNVMALKAQKKAIQTASLSRKRSGEISAAKEKATKSSKKEKASSSKSKKSGSTARTKTENKSSSTKNKNQSSKKETAAAPAKKETAAQSSKKTTEKAKTSGKISSKGTSKTQAASKDKKETAAKASGSSKSSSKSKSSTKSTKK